MPLMVQTEYPHCKVIMSTLEVKNQQIIVNCMYAIMDSESFVNAVIPR